MSIISLLPGYTLQGPFQETGGNLLYRAVRDADGLPVIVKTPRAWHPGPRERARYQREYDFLRHLRGTPGVLTVHAHEVLQDRPVLLLEDVGGSALSERPGQPLEPSHFLTWALSLAATLAEVHRRGVIHKDIKPANILVSSSGAAWLIDFGIATLQRVEHVDAVLQHQLIEGTPAYMSPEQSGRMNRAVDYRTDFYSLGVSFYEVLTGRLPFRGQDVLEWFHAHLAQAPVPPHRVVSSIPPALSAVVMKLLAKVAEERYQSAEGLRADLERCQEALRDGTLEPFPLGSRDVPARFQLPQRLYGREAEVDSLLKAFERVALSGRTEWMLVRGYSGIGKSAVVRELHRPVLRQRGFFLSGKFDQLQHDVPYSTLARAIRELVQQLLAGSDEEVALWRQRLLEAWEGHGQVLVDLVPQLERVAGAQPSLPELPPVEARNRFNRVFQRFLGVFATPERPLVFFLDDLQWADFASLELLRYISTHPDTPPLLLIGAYRDNEVSLSHPLARTLAEVREEGGRLGDIHLAPLSLEQTQRLVADAFPGAGEALVVPLASLVQEKTGGNPFFLLQWLQTLHQDGLVVRASEGGWRWDAEGVRAKGYSDNVVDFMVGRLRQLTEQTRELLRLAACVGNVFPVQMLAFLSHQEVSQVEQGLEPALQEELLVRVDAERYRFSHDRIQQAAYSLLSEEERKAVHLRVGRLLLERLSPEELHERLFEVVGHLNASVELMKDAAERSRLAHLNAEAGWRAKAANAHRSAVASFTMAFSLLPGDPWEEEGERVFKLRLAQAGSEVMSGNIAEARRLVEDLLPRARTRAEMAEAYHFKSDLLVSSSDAEGAVACLLECLEKFGMPLPLEPSWEEVVAAHEEVWSLLGARPIESLLELPPPTDPDLRAAMSVLSALFAPSFFSRRNLLLLHICRMVTLSIRHGNVESSAHAYAWFGFQSINIFKRYREGLAFSDIACRLAERQDSPAFQGEALHARSINGVWVHPFSSSREFIHKSHQQSVLAGDFRNASLCFNHSTLLPLAMGRELEDVQREAVVGFDFASKVGFGDVAHMMGVFQRYVAQLQGRSDSFSSLNGEGFDEAAFEARLAAGSLLPLRASYGIVKMMSRFMCGAHEEARQAIELVKELLWSIAGQVYDYLHHLYRALTLAACCRDAPPPRRSEYLADIEQHHRQLAEWAGNCPENFRAAERLVFAELARLNGEVEKAHRAYEEALQSAREQGSLQNAALACELAARFWKERGMSTTALLFIREAREAWSQWGAEGKARHLDGQWPALASSVVKREGSSTSYDTDTNHLDALTLVKAQQAISSEIVLERLVDTLMRVALETAGAQRGALLLLRQDTLEVAALVDSTSERTSLLEETAQRLPWSLLTYVRRSGEHVLLDDTAQPHAFSNDPYFSHGTARCLLCLPLGRGEALGGLLYLENDLATGAFSPSRIALLKHLASQASISVENARLYEEVRRAETALRRSNDELERRVEERTRELKQAQSHLVETARMVGMAEIASNILHEAGNALTSVVVDSGMLRSTVEASRVSQVRRIAELLASQREGLADFLSGDPRGRLLPDYLTILAGELLREQAALQRGLETLDGHVDRVRAIIQMQRAHAKSTLLTDEYDLAALVEEALRLHQVASRQSQVTVTKELAALPLVRVDRHRVLQILLNLLSNARRALEPVPEAERRLRVRLAAEGEWVRIQVMDNGEGLAPGVRERLFTQGFSTRKDGYGYGLHASVLAAQLMGGRLTLESDGPGKGAIATFELPFTP
ncbi:trifunctional serine/threonine-protein kinase/ATP-binding protein/sensor histidine kinase [Archangium lansingense]|uniref:Trifunctional serine/threonine-protein kinase/ATP-binding protein/sensor histidine kinase n=1 Tax=Archangium lansingense TaxID=2995310 RepID=A0ABT3ZXX9_9BACT|nr:ATP-binding sensor histidine kinase [Archangium lansinium]MCY1074260.1 trifunctional serine/threonine-protein kinase/ATP-binding protein/sensor histidine kinase [Archangium lansinium]